MERGVGEEVQWRGNETGSGRGASESTCRGSGILRDGEAFGVGARRACASVVGRMRGCGGRDDGGLDDGKVKGREK